MSPKGTYQRSHMTKIHQQRDMHKQLFYASTLNASKLNILKTKEVPKE
jgi:hypothetical protein